jgi:hypothetical protein
VPLPVLGRGASCAPVRLAPVSRRTHSEWYQLQTFTGRLSRGGWAPLLFKGEAQGIAYLRGNASGSASMTTRSSAGKAAPVRRLKLGRAERAWCPAESTYWVPLRMRITSARHAINAPSASMVVALTAASVALVRTFLRSNPAFVTRSPAVNG